MTAHVIYLPVRAGDIGEDEREYEFIPVPLTVPEPARVPVPDREAVPA